MTLTAFMIAQTAPFSGPCPTLTIEKTGHLDPKAEGVGALTNVKRLIIKVASAENRVATLSGDSQPKATLDAAKVAFAQKAATPA